MLALLVVVTHVNVSDPTTGALLGIAVRTMAGTVQDCRALSEAEIAALPQHMRRKEICETRAAPYRLEVSIDGETRLDRVYRPAGIHGDRPITVDERIGVTAGSHAVSIRFAPVDPASTDQLPVFTFAQDVDLAEGRIRVARLEGTTGGFEIR
jgi:hypothetical protein